MHPADIKALIEKADSSQADIARDCKVARTTVNKVIYGLTSSRRIAERISTITGESLETLWPGRYPALSDDSTHRLTSQPSRHRPT